MISAITWQMLAVLLAAALLGLLIGLSSMRLHQARRQKEAYNSHKAAMDKLTAERDRLNSDKTSMVQVLESEKKLGKIARDKHSQITAQQEALQVHTGLQAQQIAKLKSELHASAEKSIRLERDFASFKANKLREVRMLKVNPDEWLDNEELPVLSKKVKPAGSVGSAPSTKNKPVDYDAISPDPDQTQPIIASELDIPSLAESELPDSVEELEFELLDTKERH